MYTSAENRRTDYEIRRHSKLSNVALIFGMEEEVKLANLNLPGRPKSSFVFLCRADEASIRLLLYSILI